MALYRSVREEFEKAVRMRELYVRTLNVTKPDRQKAPRKKFSKRKEDNPTTKDH
jgi:hypothetical protein